MIKFPDTMVTLSDGSIREYEMYSDKRIELLIQALEVIAKKEAELPWQDCNLPYHAVDKIKEAIKLLTEAITWQDPGDEI